MALTRTDPPHYREQLLDRHHSSRLGEPIQAIAVHSTESDDIRDSRDDLDGVYSWFNNPESQASSHLGIDGDGHVHLWVHAHRKAWTILSLNPVTLNIEFVGRARQSGRQWEDVQIRRGAQWVAFWAQKYGLPIQRGTVKNVSGRPVITRRGIITHKQLSDAGFGTHQDPGPEFPMTYFLEQAREYRRRGWPAND